MFGMVELGPIFCLIYFSLAKFRLHIENQLCIMLGSALKVCLGGWVLKENLVIALA
jgi:hypothetical protein